MPRRLSWAVGQLAVGPADRVLEIGCGRGVAAALVAERLDTGTITAIDRSAHAVDGARLRNAEQLAAGRVVVRRAALTELSAADGPFDQIFAVNVNVFWTSPADGELDLVRSLLAPRGTFSLFYEPPAAARARELAALLTPRLTWPGATTAVVTETTGRATLLGIRTTVD
ncbi:SAM-dependent methyltransferase [Streptomyces sp. NPDC055078]